MHEAFLVPFALRAFGIVPIDQLKGAISPSRSAQGSAIGGDRSALLADVSDDDPWAQKGDAVTTPPTLFLTVGLPGPGKTTEARRIEIEEKALRLTKDEWVKALYGLANPPSASDVIEGRLIEIGLRALELGTNVVIDFGLWARDERSALRQAAADLGAPSRIPPSTSTAWVHTLEVEMRYFELPAAEQRRRLARRQTEEPHTTWHMSDDELAEWAAIISIPTPGELDGSEPVDDPPAGFSTWEIWRTHRWPPSIG